ncbi:sugar O-acyltransferase, sialic acid O-acetyltransferase NeuD family [Gracilibacillus ureilyticus]|uniref:Sugar O-acyltransferase, sialic acid O-acetyltransferase NeuD family n=1 Tax=Gracilibacillus ureilyticus TaxID=531814 RepID=A0A1H9RAN7_9BACI|nr:acetyltransferase [Gracilibacillus ureilyticus]SER69708.1 sugar O-acyltransferase, sialic acid O-acetyltransferase NeuD family [Gracilibacillus ureilyticus]
MKDKLLIIGASGHGKVVADIAIKMDKWKEIAFLDDDASIKSTMDLEVIGHSKDVYFHIDKYEVFVGIGNNSTRKRLHEMLETIGASIPVLIHPDAVIGSQVDIGVGTAIMAGVIVNCCTRIEKGCIINTGSTIDHDNWIEEFVHISPGANLAGSVKVGKSSWLGIGGVVSNNIKITNDCKIGAGAVVVKDINDPGTYVGVPARRV